MKKLILGFIALAFLTPSYAQEDGEIKLELGMKAPLTEYKLQNVDGEFKTLSGSLSEKGIIVVFSCNTCPFVVGSKSFEGWENQYNGLADYAKENGFSMVLINSNEAKREDDDSFEKMKLRAEKMAYNIPYLLDSDSRLADAFGAKTTPHVFMFDAKLKLIYTGCIDNTWDPQAKLVVPYLEQAIREYAKGAEISFPETAPKGCSIKRVIEND